MLNRKIDALIERHYATEKKPLFITGARQVGKSYAMEKYARAHFPIYVECNFYKEPQLVNLVRSATNEKDLLSKLSLFKMVSFVEGKTNINYGAIYENVVAQELHAHGWDLYYFTNKKQGELDFLLEQDDKIVPIEVKSGKDYERHNALTNVINNAEYNIENALVLCNDNIKVVGKVIYVPIYMLMFIHKQQISSPLIYKPNFSGLA